MAWLALPLASLGAWRLFRPTTPPAVITAARVQRGDLVSAITATGTLEPPRTVDVKYDTQSLVTALYVKEGDRVAKDQPLATMDISLLRLALAQAQQNLEKDRATLAQATSALRRAEALAADQLIAPVDLESARTNYQALSHQTEADQDGVKQAQEQINRCILRSPIDGVVIALYVHEGEMLGSAAAVAALGSAAAVTKPTNVLMTLAEAGAIEVDADVNEVDLGGVLIGQRARFTADALEPAVFDGAVRRIALQPTVTNGVTTYRVVVGINGHDTRFRIGLPVNVMLFTTRARNVVLLPPAAVVRDATGSWVRVIRLEGPQPHVQSVVSAASADDRQASITLQKVMVRILATTNTAAAVEGPLRPGEMIAMEGVRGLKDGQQVSVLLSLAPFTPILASPSCSSKGERPDSSCNKRRAHSPKACCNGLSTPNETSGRHS